MNPQNFGAISFPFLGLEVNPPRSFALGPLNIHFYGLIIAVGLALVVIYACRRSKEFGITEDDILDGVLWVAPFAVICARAYYVAFSWDQYRDNLISVLHIWNGGIAIYGGVIGAILGVIVLCKVKKIKLGTMLDLVMLGFLIGQSIGRWGNFFNREAFGAETDSFFRMGLHNVKTGVTAYYHPTFLYESLWNAVGFVILHFASKKRKYDGQVALGYAAWYGLGRLWIEGLRMDSLYWGPFRVSQLLAAVSCIATVIVLTIHHFKPHDRADLFVNQVAAAAESTAETPEETEEAEAAEEITGE